MRGDPVSLAGRRLSHSAKVSSATKRTNQKQHTHTHTHTHTHGETKEQGPPQLSRLSVRPLALGRRFESCWGRSMEHWQKDAARKSTSNIAAKGGSLPRQKPHKAQDSSRGFFAGGACQVIVRLDPDAATAGGHQVYIKSSILIRYTSSNKTCSVDVITCPPSATCPGI